MVQAVLVEDDARVREFVSEKLVDSFARRNEMLTLSAYETAEGFLRTVDEARHYDVLFLDIEMPGMDGLTLARRMRRLMPQVLLVFISGRDQWVFKTFEVQPFRFVRKQEFLQQLDDLAADLVEAIRERSRCAIILTEPGTGDLYSFDAHSLSYVEARRKECRLVSDSGVTMMRCTPRYLRDQLQPWGFIQCHRSYLVNWRAIYRLGKTNVLLTNGEDIPLSRGLREQARCDFMRRIGQEVS